VGYGFLQEKPQSERSTVWPALQHPAIIRGTIVSTSKVWGPPVFSDQPLFEVRGEATDREEEPYLQEKCSCFLGGGAACTNSAFDAPQKG